MQFFKHKFFVIALFFLLIAPVTVSFVLLKYQKKQVKREIKWKMIAGLDKKELVLLKFTEEEKNAQLRWEHSREFEYKGEMYDIVEATVIGDTTYYRCWRDHEETKLNKQLNQLVAFAWGNNPKNHEKHNRLLKFFKLFYFSETTERKNIADEELTVKKIFRQKFYSSELLSPPSPPPELV